MKLIVGLGNPGGEYGDHRHNVGFRVVDWLAERHRVAISQRKFGGRCGSGSIGGEKVVLLKPETFMNLSGDSVAEAARFYKSEGEDLIVAHDELDLPLGRLQLRRGGGTAGHHGVTHIAQRLGTTDFLRVRIGIGKPAGPGEKDRVVGHVLGAFAADERPAARDAIEEAAAAIEAVIERGLKAAMNQFNRRERTEKTEEKERP